MFDDFDLIVSSFQTQYGIRIYSKDFKEMKWNEFTAFLSGIGPDTPLGRIVTIRAENDKDILKNFTKEQKRIRDTWRNRTTEYMSKTTYESEMKSLENMFRSMCN